MTKIENNTGLKNISYLIMINSSAILGHILAVP